jgi:hypothetical protein
MDSVLMDFLYSYKNKTIRLSQLESLAPGSASYSDFIRAIKVLEENDILVPIQSQGKNTIDSSIANAFRVRKFNLHKGLHEQIRKKQRLIHSLIQLTAYFWLPEEVWAEDQIYIDQLDKYLRGKGVPEFPAPVPERSYELMGDEKWLQEGGGESFLHRVSLYQAMKVTPVPEPLMFSVNPKLMDNHTHHHLIVENKTAYYSLSGILAESPFTTLIYGEGKGFLNSIIYLERQINLPNHEHVLHYFGDIDFEGIKIWFMLNRVRATGLALPFYRALLDKPYQTGKLNHKKDEKAYDCFISYFSLEEQRKINLLFDDRGYYPQEALSGSELCSIWRKSWKDF